MIHFPSRAAENVSVIEVTTTEAIIQTSNQTKWPMVQVGAKEFDTRLAMQRGPPPHIGS
jgi:hypothetical protein